MKRFNLHENIRKLLSLTKRQQFVIVTILLTIEIMITQLTGSTLRWDILLILAVSTFGLTALVLREELSGWELLTLLTLPTFYTVAVYLFYLLLPTRWLTRLPVAALYAIGMYAILLTENIYNVAAERNIQLLRAAHSVGFLLTLVTVFLLMDTVVSLHLPLLANVGLGMGLLFPLMLQTLWAMELTDGITPAVWLYSAICTLLISELMGVFSLWPIKTTMLALLLTASFYTLTGISQQQLVGRLFPTTGREYLSILLLVLIFVVLTTRWGSAY